MKKLILFISIVIYSASAYSQEVTREDYGNYILETDSYHINRFAEERYFLVQRILHLGNRKYRVAYWNPNTGKELMEIMMETNTMLWTLNNMERWKSKKN